MSITSELNRLQQAKSDLATSITNKGVTVPAATTLDGYAALVDQIQTGGWYYTAEVQWIKSDGNSYIDTGITYDSTVKVEAKMKTVDRTAGTLFGLYFNDGTTRRWSLSTGGNDGKIWYYLNNITNKYYSYTADTWYTFILDSRYLTVNGTRYDSGASAFSTGTTPVSLYIFGRHNVQPNSSIDTKDGLGKYVLEYMKIYKNNAVVRDYIPVRIGQVGYLYDKVSKTLFYNQGTGNFTFGSDVV